MWIDLLTILFVIAGLFVVIHFGSKIQMRAWLQEIEKFLTDKYKSTKNEEENEQKTN
jgi:ribosomal silencing factor RsfS